MFNTRSAFPKQQAWEEKPDGFSASHSALSWLCDHISASSEREEPLSLSARGKKRQCRYTQERWSQTTRKNPPAL